MRFLLSMALLTFAHVALASHATGNDDSDKATYTANCNASFQVDCPDIHADDTTVSSSSVAAPMGALGDSGLESVLLLAAILGFAMFRSARRRALAIHVRRELPSAGRRRGT